MPSAKSSFADVGGAKAPADAPKSPAIEQAKQGAKAAPDTKAAPPPPPPPAPPSDGDAIVQKALSQVGTMESDSGKYADAAGGTKGEAWCGDFTEWVYGELGKDKPPARSVPRLLDWAKSKGKLTKDPTAGDLVMFDWDKDGTPDHVGIVRSKDGSTVHTVEGNTSTNGGLGVATKDRPMSDIIGFVDTA